MNEKHLPLYTAAGAAPPSGYYVLCKDRRRLTIITCYCQWSREQRCPLLVCPQVTSSSLDWVQACTTTCPSWWPPEKVSRAAWPRLTSTVGCRTCWATPCSAAAKSTADVKVLRPWDYRPIQSTAQSTSTSRPAAVTTPALESIHSGVKWFYCFTSFTSRILSCSSCRWQWKHTLFLGCHPYCFVTMFVVMMSMRSATSKCGSGEMCAYFCSSCVFLLVCVCFHSSARLQCPLKSLMHNFAFVSFLLWPPSILPTSPFCLFSFDSTVRNSSGSKTVYFRLDPGSAMRSNIVPIRAHCK